MCREQGREVLEFEVGRDGWEELCGFLGCEVPNDEFPRANEANAFNEYWRPAFEALDGVVMMRALAVVGGLLAVGLGVWGVRFWY